MIGIVDYGMGNILSVVNAVEMLGEDAAVCKNPEQLRDADKIILPGVGAFGDCMENLKQRSLVDALNVEVLDKKKPILGICLGMQVMAKKGFEGGVFDGLGWFDAEVIRLGENMPSLHVPHVGWNEVTFNKGHFLGQGLPAKPDLYFVHSYFMKCRVAADVIAVCHYGQEFTAAVQKGNIVATQFHPEKSQDYGLKILDNFLTFKPSYAEETINSKTPA